MLYSKIFLITLVIIGVSNASELSEEDKIRSEIEQYEKELSALEPLCNDHGVENHVHSRSKRSIFALKLVKLALLKKLLLKKKLLLGGGLLLGKKALILPAILPALTKGASPGAAPALPQIPSFKMMPELPSLTSLPLVPELLSKVQSIKDLVLMPKAPMMMHHPPPPPPPMMVAFKPMPPIDDGYHYAPPAIPFAKYGPP